MKEASELDLSLITSGEAEIAFRKLPPQIGDSCPRARRKALLTIELKGLRGLPKDKANKAVMKVRVEDQTFESVPSEYQEAVQDITYDTQSQEIDPVAQRLAECLAKRHDMPVREIAAISGLDEASLHKIFKNKPSFTTRWDHAFHILLDNPETATVSMRLLIAGEREPAHWSFGGMMSGVITGSGACGVPAVELGEPFRVNQLLLLEDMKWDGSLSMRRNTIGRPRSGTSSSGGTPMSSQAASPRRSADTPVITSNPLVDSSFPTGPFDLEVQCRLWALAPSITEDCGVDAKARDAHRGQLHRGSPEHKPHPNPSTSVEALLADEVINLDSPSPKNTKSRWPCCGWKRRRQQKKAAPVAPKPVV